MKTLAIIPARGGSKRLPGKNVRSFLERPLIHWSIEFARLVGKFDQIVVSTDSDNIADCCASVGLDVPYRRTSALASDTASSVDVVLDALEKAEAAGSHFDLVALLQPTSPIRELSRWERAFSLLEQTSCDAVIGVSPVRDHPFQVFSHESDMSLSPWVDAKGLGLRSQDLPPAVCVNGSLYLVRSSVLRQERTFFPMNTKGVLCDAPYEFMDIDTEADWVIAEALAVYYGKKS